jgi:glc operon protein GlcG
METVIRHLKLTQTGALVLLNAAVEKAAAMGQPQCIAIVDDGCNLLAFLRMDGAKPLSQRSATQKARTAASSRVPTGTTPPELELKLGLATDGEFTNLLGGLPIIVDGYTIGGIGVGSGTGSQDREVANFALSRLPGALTFD